MAEWMVGVDTGGTFTDLVAFAPESGELRTIKVPSEPSDPSTAVINALNELFRTGIAPSEIGSLVHGTTVATNAVLESAGVCAGLLITRGFRAVYEARGWVRPDPAELLDTFFRKPPLLVPQSRTEEIPERLDYQGTVLEPLDEEAVRARRHAALRQEASMRWPYATFSASATPRTKSVPRRFLPRRSPTGASRYRPAFCR